MKNLKEKRLSPSLQVALDLLSLDEALTIVSEVAPYVDILEAGTPLIKSEGIKSVQILKEIYPEKLVCADLKIADAGYLEVRMAAKAGADIITVLADAYNVTIEESLRAAREFKVEIMADFIMSRRPKKRLEEIKDLNYMGKKLTYALVHSGLDRQESRYSPLLELQSVANIPDHPKLAIAGGIQVKDISKMKSYDLDIIIIGGAITRVENPEVAAKKFRNAINENS
ncbi:MAG: 3-hexulose-6-phosphate synthase [Candidatus Lokiarchaeota archaeon]|nr:3-hexulose-6-phosphate synthase [Candidatus Lokiarchaeota archaeon]